MSHLSQPAMMQLQQQMILQAHNNAAAYAAVAAAQHRPMAAISHANGMMTTTEAAGIPASPAATPGAVSHASPPSSSDKIHAAVRLFEAWHSNHPVHRSSFRPLSDLSLDVLLSVVGDWIVHSRKTNGGDYTIDTMYVYLSSLQRHVRRTHGMPAFTFLDSQQVRTAMESKFGADALSRIMAGGRGTVSPLEISAAITVGGTTAGTQPSTAAAAAATAARPSAAAASAAAAHAAEYQMQLHTDEEHKQTGDGVSGKKRGRRQGPNGKPLPRVPTVTGLAGPFNVSAVKDVFGASAGAAAAASSGGAAAPSALSIGGTRVSSGAGGVTTFDLGLVNGGAGMPAAAAGGGGIGALPPMSNIITFKPPKPSHSHRSFRTEQRLLSARQDPSTPEGLLRCLLWVMFTHVPTLANNACWSLKTSQFHVRMMVDDPTRGVGGAIVDSAAAAAAAAATAVAAGRPEPKIIRFLQYTPARKSLRPDSRVEHMMSAQAAQQDVVMYEQPSIPHCCPVTLFNQFMSHRPHSKIAAANASRMAHAAAVGDTAALDEDNDAGSHMWLLTRKGIESTGEEANVWYANRRIGSGTMDKLITVVKASRNQAPLPGVDALAQRAASLEAEDLEDGGAVEQAVGNGVMPIGAMPHIMDGGGAGAGEADDSPHKRARTSGRVASAAQAQLDALQQHPLLSQQAVTQAAADRMRQSLANTPHGGRKAAKSRKSGATETKAEQTQQSQQAQLVPHVSPSSAAAAAALSVPAAAGAAAAAAVFSSPNMSVSDYLSHLTAHLDSVRQTVVTLERGIAAVRDMIAHTGGGGGEGGGGGGDGDGDGGGARAGAIGMNHAPQLPAIMPLAGGHGRMQHHEDEHEPHSMMHE